MENKKKLTIILVTALVTAVASIVITLLCVNFYIKSLPVPVENIIRAGRIIEENYVGDFDPEVAEEKMMNALIESLGDKYAVYYNEQDAKETFELIEGNYVGIGVEVFANTEKDKIEVISAYKGTPADKAGLKSGDYIVSVDGKKYGSGDIAEAILYIKGVNEEKPLEKEIEIVIERNGENIVCKLKREEISLYKTESEIIDGICYIRYTGFTESSEKEVEKILTSLEKSTKGVVIDVRNNPGGDFVSAIELCDLFLDDGMIMYTVDKAGKKEEYYAKEKKYDFPLAVIVNSSSASASEIFAGSMQANKRAVIIGEKTYGKGVTQTVRYINYLDKSAGAMKFTTLKNYTPDGRWINKSIIPDVKVSGDINPNIREDAAFLAAVKSIKEEN